MKPFSEDIKEQEENYFELEAEQEEKPSILENVKEKFSEVAESAKEAIFGKDEPDAVLGLPIETLVSSGHPVCGSALLEKGSRAGDVDEAYHRI
uniref:Uncharacterized protein n=1 Tax=Acrobeloides nanus TaxID=290746 RepID=A0A914C8W1_9BILA